MAEGYVFQISGDVAQYAQAMAQIPGVTEKAAAQAALKASPQFIKLYDNAEKAAQKAAKNGEVAFEKSAKKVGEDASKLGSAFSAISPTAGMLVQDLGKFSQAASVLGPELTVFASGFAAAGAAVAAPLLALGAMDGVLVKLAFDAKANLEALKGFQAIGSDFYPEIPASTLASFDALAASQAALTSIGEHLAVTLAADVAPSVERAADVVVGLALESDKLIEGWAKGRDLFEELATRTISAFGTALMIPLQPIRAMQHGLIALADAAGVAVAPSLREADAELGAFLDHGFGDELAHWTVSTVENSTAMRGLSASLQGAENEGRAFLTTQERATEAQKAGKTSIIEQNKALDDWGRSMAARIDQIRQEIDAISAAADIAQAGIEAQAQAQATLNGVLGVAPQKVDAVNAEITKLFQSYIDGKIDVDAFSAAMGTLEQAQTAAMKVDRITAARSAMQSYGASATSVLGSVADAAGIAMDAIDPKKHKAAFMAAFEAQKAAAIAQAVINSILAVSNALALPLPPPAPQIAAVAAGAAGAVEVAKIAASPPPKFHTGTLYATPGASYRADEFPATLQRGEVVIDRVTASRPGVREAVASAMNGGGTGSTSPDDLAEGLHRSGAVDLLAQILRELRRPTPPAPRSNRPGHRESYGY